MKSRSLIMKEKERTQAVRGLRQRGLSRKHREWIAAFLFLLPDMLGLILFLGIPMMISLGLGFFEVDGFGNVTFTGFTNYTTMLSDPQFMNSLRITLLYIFIFVPSLFVCSLFLALLIKQKIPLVGVFRSMFFLPNVVSLVVVGFVWKFLLTDQIGLINQLLQIIGISGNSWLGDPKFALGTILVVTVWFSMGYYMIIFLAGLQEIPQEYYEAAHLDGASHWATFRYVTWPLLKPTDARWPRQFNLSGDLLHLSAGFSVRSLWICRGNGFVSRSHSVNRDHYHVRSDEGGAL